MSCLKCSCSRCGSDHDVSMCSAIDTTPQILKAVMNPVSHSSGWTYIVVGAGPVPEDKGKIGTISYVYLSWRA